MVTVVLMGFLPTMPINPFDLLEVDPTQQNAESIRQGLPVTSALRLGERLNISMAHLGSLIGVSERTLARYKQKVQILQPVASDRLYRLARVLALAEEIFESEEIAKNWLRRPNRALSGAIPLDLLDTDMGAEQVSDLLNRIDYGVYS